MTHMTPTDTLADDGAERTYDAAFMPALRDLDAALARFHERSEGVRVPGTDHRLTQEHAKFCAHTRYLRGSADLIERLRSSEGRVVHDFTDRPQAPRLVVDGYWADTPADETNGHYLTAWDVVSHPWFYGSILSALSVGSAAYWLFGG